METKFKKILSEGILDGLRPKGKFSKNDPITRDLEKGLTDICTHHGITCDLVNLKQVRPPLNKPLKLEDSEGLRDAFLHVGFHFGITFNIVNIKFTKQFNM